MTAVENKIPDVSNLVKKTNYNTKISEIKKKVSHHDHDNKYITISEFNKLTTENFKSRLAQANLVTKTDFNAKLINCNTGTESISECKSKGSSDEVIEPSDNTLAPTVKYTGKRMYVKFNRSFLKQDKITFNHGKIVNIYIVYDLTDI